jgi:hypothetical protein
VVKNHAVVLGDEHIREAVAVVITHGDAHPITASGNASLLTQMDPSFGNGKTGKSANSMMGLMSDPRHR